MSLSTSMLDLQLFRDSDDANDVALKTILQTLVLGKISSSQAAIDFDNWLVSVTKAQRETYFEWLKTSDPWEEVGPLTPRPSSTFASMFESIPRLLSAFPPKHDGQTRIFEFLEELRKMPKKQLLAVQYDHDETWRIRSVNFYSFGENTSAIAWNEIRQESEATFYPFSDVETPGHELQIRWRNFQSGLAQLTVRGFMDCGFLTSLAFILPEHMDYPLEKRPVAGPNRISADVIAGGAWLTSLEACRWVYKECKTKERLENPREVFSMESWRIWKSQFIMVSEDRRFLDEAKEVAKVALHQMNETENE